MISLKSNKIKNTLSEDFVRSFTLSLLNNLLARWHIGIHIFHLEIGTSNLGHTDIFILHLDL